MISRHLERNKLWFVLLCLTNESNPSFEKNLGHDRIPRESVENNLGQALGRAGDGTRTG